jgi:putative salt-induced outer membrane protein YdiY
VNRINLSVLPRIALLLIASCALRAAADVVVTTSGARLVGKITGIHEGVVTLDTDYAGEIKVRQDRVASIETDRAVAVRLKDGRRVVGTVTEAEGGKLRIADRGGDVFSGIGDVAASWAAADEDPDVVAKRRKWTFTAGADINGDSGTNHQMGTEGAFKADLKGPDDELQLYTNYNRQVTNGQKSEDQFKADADYALNFSEATSWYVRDEAGFDRVMDITFEDVAAAGFGYDFIKIKDETLTGRVGLSYRQYDYAADADTPSLSALGGDVELQFSRMIGKSQLSDKVAYMPDFQDTANYLVTHDFAYIIPITKSLWKLSIGVTNNYNSKPVDSVSKIETLYYTRLELTWGQH